MVSVFTTVFMCRPISYFWNHDQEGRCIDREVIWFLNASVGLVTDSATLIIPIPTLIKLQMPRRLKIELISLFSLGAM